MASVFAGPLPPIDYVRVEGVPVTLDAYNSHPALVEEWHLDPAAVLAAAETLPDTASAALHHYRTPICSSEGALASRLSVVMELTNKALSAAGDPKLKQASWLQEPNRRVFGPPVGAAAAAADLRARDCLKPDFELWQRGDDAQSVCFFEAKLPEMLEFIGTESLAAQWNRDRASNTQSNATRAIAQATSYAAASGARFFAISTYDVTWLAKVPEPGVIAITTGFAREATGPSVLQALWYLSTEAISQGPSQSWQALQTPRDIPAERGPELPVAMAPQATAESGPGQGWGDRDKSSTSTARAADAEMFRAFEVTGCLGSGMSGVVYQARLGDVDVALKLSSDREVLPILREEVRMYRLLERLQGSVLPRLVGHGWSAVGCSYWVATSLVPGSSLASAGTWQQQHSANAVLCAGLAALNAFHAAGALHGDIRPENVMVGSTPEGLPRVTLLDLGMAELSECPDGRERERSMLVDAIRRCAGSTK